MKSVVAKSYIMGSVASLASRLKESLPNKNHSHPMFVGLLDGCHPFMTDLLRHLQDLRTIEVGYMKAISYSEGGDYAPVIEFWKNKPPVRIEPVTNLQFQGRDVYLIDTLLDTGDTLSKAAEEIWCDSPRSIQYVTLLRRGQDRLVPGFTKFFTAGTSAYEVPDHCHFLVGYGLDDNRKLRHLDEIYELPKEP